MRQAAQFSHTPADRSARFFTENELLPPDLKPVRHALGSLHTQNSKFAGSQARRLCFAAQALHATRGYVFGRIWELGAERDCFLSPLLERYRAFFEIVRTARDQPNPQLPFFFLRSDGFWHLQPLPGKESVVAAMRGVRSAREISENINWAFLDDALFELILEPTMRTPLREALISRWFPQHWSLLIGKIEEERIAGQYEIHLRDLAEGKGVSAPDVGSTYTEKARSSAFRRTVVEAYDFRCAATGWRIMLPDGQVMVEAAHLIPFAVSKDDDPRNGIALTPTFHWALDRNLVAPGPDLRWHVSKLLDERLPDNKPLLELKGKTVLLPPSAKYRPRTDSLQYRLERLCAAQ
jgi:putative restriction endonuclease